MVVTLIVNSKVGRPVGQRILDDHKDLRIVKLI